MASRCRSGPSFADGTEPSRTSGFGWRRIPKLPADAPERRLAAALEWHGWECYSRHVICRLLGCQPLLVASDDELMAILDVNPVDPRMSAWDRLAEREWDARLHESNHRTLMRHASRTAWLAARQAGR